MHFKMSSAKWQPFCPGGDELSKVCYTGFIAGYAMFMVVITTIPTEWKQARYITEAMAFWWPNHMSGIYVFHWLVGGLPRWHWTDPRLDLDWTASFTMEEGTDQDHSSLHSRLIQSQHSIAIIWHHRSGSTLDQVMAWHRCQAITWTNVE